VTYLRALFLIAALIGCALSLPPLDVTPVPPLTIEVLP
jgi:hypothetical protein